MFLAGGNDTGEKNSWGSEDAGMMNECPLISIMTVLGVNGFAYQYNKAASLRY